MGLFTLAMVVLPVGSYFVSRDYYWGGAFAALSSSSCGPCGLARSFADPFAPHRRPLVRSSVPTRARPRSPSPALSPTALPLPQTTSPAQASPRRAWPTSSSWLSSSLLCGRMLPRLRLRAGRRSVRSGVVGRVRGRRTCEPMRAARGRGDGQGEGEKGDVIPMQGMIPPLFVYLDQAV